MFTNDLEERFVLTDFFFFFGMSIDKNDLHYYPSSTTYTGVIAPKAMKGQAALGIGFRMRTSWCALVFLEAQNLPWSGL